VLIDICFVVDSFTYNLGTGRGATVLEIVVAFSKASGKEIPYKIVGRRTGDVPVLEADPTKANQELGWVAKRGVEEMCADSWNWQQKNPDGYNTV
jgi:UDP-glucose 4-epimerase